MKRLIWSLLALLILTACDPSERVNKPGLREAVENRKIYRITDAEIQQRALLMGDSFASVAEKTLGGALKQAITEKGVTEAIAFCNVNAYPLLEDLQASNNIVIRRVSMKNRNPKNAPEGVEKQLLEAFHYNDENNIDITPSVQQEGDHFYYVKPIYTKGLCMNCHGTVGKQVDSVNFAKLKELYPHDKATGYDIDALRGMWSIKIPKKEVVLAISDDKWKPKYEKKKKRD